MAKIVESDSRKTGLDNNFFKSIAVAAWLLVKLETKLDSAEAAARDLAAKIQAHMDWCMKCQTVHCQKEYDNR